MDRKLIDYLPQVLRGVLEFASITDAQQPEVEAAWDAVSLVLSNQFIDTATEAGVAMWEEELGIIPPATNTLDERKARIKSLWIGGAVYTLRWLIEWLKAACGEDGASPTVEDYTVHLTLPSNVDYINLIDGLRQYIPANMAIDALIDLASPEIRHYFGIALRIASQQSITTDSWDASSVSLLADENGRVLIERAGGLVLYEEATT